MLLAKHGLFFHVEEDGAAASEAEILLGLVQQFPEIAATHPAPILRPAEHLRPHDQVLLRRAGRPRRQECDDG